MNENNFNKKSLCAFWQIRFNTLNLFIADLCENPEKAIEFGKYRGKRFTNKQLKLLSEYTGYPLPK